MNRSDLFEGLDIWKDVKYRQLQGTYPVIFMSFASVKTGKIEGIKTAFKRIIYNIYNEHSDIMASDLFNDNDRENFASINVRMDDDTAYIAINSLCIYLEKYYGEKAIVILDEYDTPMQESLSFARQKPELGGTWDVAVEFFGIFFNITFKTNANRRRSVSST